MAEGFPGVSAIRRSPTILRSAIHLNSWWSFRRKPKVRVSCHAISNKSRRRTDEGYEEPEEAAPVKTPAKPAVDKAKPVLDVLGENIFYLGALGAGHTTKLINNFMGMTTVCAMSQAFAVADLAGVDREQLWEIMSTGPSNSPFMQFCKNYAVDGVSDLGFSINNANKDLGYFLEMVEDLGTRAQIAEGTSSNLKAAVDAGMGNGNVPEIFDYFLKLEK